MSFFTESLKSHLLSRNVRETKIPWFDFDFSLYLSNVGLFTIHANTDLLLVNI